MVSRKEKTRKGYLLALSSLPMLAAMALIFWFSHQAGGSSSAQSNAVGVWVTELLGIEVPAGTPAASVPVFLGFNIRKLAHIFLYVLLGAGTLLFCAALPLPAVGAWRPVSAAGCATAVCFVYACLDEWHQSFVAGRTCAMEDVGVDGIGFVSAIAFCMAVWYLVRALRVRRAR